MELILVSVIIPAYNSRVYLRETVESVLLQTYSHIEIILINDGSTDGTEELFSEFEAKNVICLSQPNLGASAARNYGFSISSGKYIQFLDADDLLYPNKLEEQVKQMEAQGAELSFTFWGHFTDDVKKVQQFHFNHINFSIIRDGKDVMRSFGRDNWVVLPVAWLVRRNLIEKAGYWNEYISNNDDGEYFSRILFWAKSVIVIEKQLAYYRTSNGNSLSSMNTVQKAYSALNSWKLIHALIQSAQDESLLAYPKRGFWVNFHMTKKKFPLIARQCADIFDKINVPFFLSKGLLYILIQYFGLRIGSKFFIFLRKVIGFVYK